jgi:hypothetical protein
MSRDTPPRPPVLGRVARRDVGGQGGKEARRQGGKGGACAITSATPKAPLRSAPRRGRSPAEGGAGPFWWRSRGRGRSSRSSPVERRRFLAEQDAQVPRPAPRSDGCTKSSTSPCHPGSSTSTPSSPQGPDQAQQPRLVTRRVARLTPVCPAQTPDSGTFDMTELRNPGSTDRGRCRRGHGSRFG